MNRPLIVRSILRLVAALLVWKGVTTEEVAESIFMDPDVQALASLVLAEIYLYIEKGVAWLRRRWAA